LATLLVGHLADDQRPAFDHLTDVLQLFLALLLGSLTGRLHSDHRRLVGAESFHRLVGAEWIRGGRGGRRQERDDRGGPANILLLVTGAREEIRLL
jgi:hypothetical protein